MKTETRIFIIKYVGEWRSQLYFVKPYEKKAMDS